MSIRKYIGQVSKGKISKDQLAVDLKFSFNLEERNYILNKLAPTYKEFVFNNPVPTYDEDLCGIPNILYTDSDLRKELEWALFSVLEYSEIIKKAESLRINIENAFLLKSAKEVYDLLDIYSNEIGVSMFALEAEILLNELSKNQQENLELIKKFSIDSELVKIPILLEFCRFRSDPQIPAWQYDSLIEQHKKNYLKQSNELLEVIDFSLDPANLEKEFEHLDYVIFFNSNFAIHDRYIKLKKVLPLVLNRNLEEETRLSILDLCRKINEDSEDTYWNKLLLIHDKYDNSILKSDFQNAYNIIQDQYLKGEYEKVIDNCVTELRENPRSSDLYLFCLKAISFENKKVTDYFEEESQLFEILELLMQVLNKSETYLLSRDKLLKKYYALSIFSFSSVLQEFVYNENMMHMPNLSREVAFLNSEVLRYNSYNVLSRAANKTNNKWRLFESDCETLNYGNQTDHGKAELFFRTKIRVGKLLIHGEYDTVIDVVEDYRVNLNEKENREFVTTWINRNLIKAYINTGEAYKAADLIVDNYFRKGIAFNHFFDKILVDELADHTDEFDSIKYLAIPIFYKIYNQPQAFIYDAIANFLIAHEVRLVSELLELTNSFPRNKYLYFLEKVATKENIADSPFLNSIEELENERIQILTQLKVLDPEREEKFNDELLNIAKETNIRKGLKQLHESRIYVDISNISKLLESDMTEMFNRYLELDDFFYTGISSLKLDDVFDQNKISLTYYHKEPIEEKEVPLFHVKNNIFADPNVVVVPLIRFDYFQILFEQIKQEFVFNEDFGFKTFLSMRIRHGTFSNVLRSVFEKNNLVSTKAPNSEEYQDVAYWNNKLPIKESVLIEFQNRLRLFSEQVDARIDNGLKWISIDQDDDNSNVAEGKFNFSFSNDDFLLIFHNRVGRINDFDLFVNEVYSILFERLDVCLNELKKTIELGLSPLFIKDLEHLEKEIESLGIKEGNFSRINESLTICKTEIQHTCNTVLKWFNVTNNQYVDEFPLELIIQSSLDYVDSINNNAFSNCTVTVNNNINDHFSGKYFESFGDIFNNLFDNAISKNKELGNKLIVSISVNRRANDLIIEVANNLASSVEKESLNGIVEDIRKKVEFYKNGEITSSFEEGSGFLKICKCLSADFGRTEYSVDPVVEDGKFKVTIKFNIEDLLI